MRKPQSSKAALAFAMTAFLICTDAGGQTAVAQPPAIPPSPSPPWVAVVSALAWPVAAIIVAVAFRRPLGDFFRGLATRVTKLSVFKVELELAAAPSAGASPLLDDIRTATAPAAISDSSRAMLDQAQSTLPADLAIISLDFGEAWLTSRLFIAAAMLERMRGVKVFVFLESTPATTRRFLAVAPLAQVRWTLAQQFPWLEAAWIRAYLSMFPSIPPAGITVPMGAAWLPDPRTLSMTTSPIESTSGALSPSKAREVVSQFITLLQESATPSPPSAAPPSGTGAAVPSPKQPQMQPSVMLRSGAWERANWVTRDLLKVLLPDEAFDLWADAGRDAPRMRRTRGVLRRPAPFVALVQGDREYVRLVNRAALLEQIADSLGEEPESNPA